MKQRFSATLAGSSIVILATSMGTHAAETAATAPEATVALEEVVVTAQRREEALQDVPATVNVVTSQDLQKYNILEFEDVQKLVPGLQLLNANNGFQVNASMRGITYNESQATTPTVSFYVNDVPLDANFVFNSMYDVGQIEVLRGPQGTLRGETSPSGSMTVMSHRPDLEQFGGYVSGTVGTLQNTNAQGAFNLPLIDGKLAIRLAGTRNEDSVNGIHSLVNPQSSNEITSGGRVSVRFDPIDSLDAVMTFQHLVHSLHSYPDELVGSGAPGGIVPGATYAAPPANYNGPPLTANELLTVSPAQNYINGDFSDAELLVDWRFAGQKLSYVGGWAHLDTYSIQNEDQPNAIPGYVYIDDTYGNTIQWTQEMRLASDERLFGKLDYTVGFFFNTEVNSGFATGVSYNTGAFGSPLQTQPTLGPPNNYYALNDVVVLPANTYEYAGYASTTYHIDQKTEITGGIRYSTQERYYFPDIIIVPGAHSASATTAAACAARHGAYGATYPGVCDTALVIPDSPLAQRDAFHPVIYNIEASHHFTDDLMVYFRTGTSYRPGQLLITGNATTVALIPYQKLGPEKSTTYEGGVKFEFFDKRLLLDADYYHQDYKGLDYTSNPSYYLSTNILAPTQPPSVKTAGPSLNVPAKVDGIELTTSGLITPHWTATGVFAWANGHLSDATIPCNPPIAGVPTVAFFQAAGYLLNQCKSSTSTSNAPRWNFNVQSQYNQPIASNLEAFARTLVYYYPSNPFASPPYVVKAFTTVDLFLGLHRPDSAWEVSLYGKNIGDERAIISLSQTQLTSAAQNFFGNTGYYEASTNPRREFGLTARYAFGSR